MIEDYLEEAPTTTEEPVQVAGPISFDNKKEPSSAEPLLDAFSLEVSQMKSLYDLVRSQRKRTTVGILNLCPEDAAAFITTFVKDENCDKWIGDFLLSDSLRMAAEDIKAFYLEGVGAQPGQSGDHKTLGDWFWGESYAARVINEVRKLSLKQDAKDMNLLGNLLLVPGNQMHRFKD